MAAKAKFSIHVPTRDNLGNQLRDLATAAHQHLFQNAGIDGSYIERGKDGNWRDDPQEKLDHLVTFADDTPEIESHMKQTAAHIGDLANQWGVTVTKEGKDGPNLWVIDNPNYAEGAPAQDAALEPFAKQLVSTVLFGESERPLERLSGTLVDYLEGNPSRDTTGP